MVRALAAVLCLVSAAVSSSQGADRARAFLTDHLHISDSDLRRIARGEAVAHSLDTSDKREVASMGVVRIAVPAGEYARRLADIVNFKKHEAVLQIGTFDTPAVPADVAGLTIDESEARELRDCRLRDCDMQLPATAIDRLGGGINWSGPEVAEQVSRVLREALVSRVNAYRARGDSALLPYVDESDPVDAGQEFAALLDSDSGILEALPALTGYLRQYPAGRRPEGRDIIYWSKEKLGPSPIVTVTHMAILRLPETSPVAYAAASKQIYGSRYFYSSLGLTLLLPDLSASSPATYVVYVNRSRIDALGGILGPIKRQIVRARARSGIADSLERMKKALEAI